MEGDDSTKFIHAMASQRLWLCTINVDRDDPVVSHDKKFAALHAYYHELWGVQRCRTVLWGCAGGWVGLALLAQLK